MRKLLRLISVDIEEVLHQIELIQLKPRNVARELYENIPSVRRFISEDERNLVNYDESNSFH